MSELGTVIEAGLLVTAFLITITSSISRVIWIYRLQSVVLAVVTGLAALLVGEARLPFVSLIILLPLALAAFIRLLLARATSEPQPGVRTRWTQVERAAERVWRISSEAAVSTRLVDVAVFLGLAGLAFVVATRPPLTDVIFDDLLGLTVSLTLLLTGLYNMVSKRDIISQIIGLLVMDHGLYLAVVKVVPVDSRAATLFVIGLYFYTLITISILVFLLPQVRRLTDEIDLDEIARHSQLKG